MNMVICEFLNFFSNMLMVYSLAALTGHSDIRPETYWSNWHPGILLNSMQTCTCTLYVDSVFLFTCCPKVYLRSSWQKVISPEVLSPEFFLLRDITQHFRSLNKKLQYYRGGSRIFFKEGVHSSLALLQHQ